MKHTTPKSITHAQYLQLQGLKLLVTNHWRAIEDLEKAAYTITEERDREGNPETCGHTSDMLLDTSATIEEMLEALNIKVAKVGGRKS